MRVSACIDNITILGQADKYFQDWLYDDGYVSKRMELFKNNPVPEEYVSYRSTAKYPYRFQWVMGDGTIIQEAEQRAKIKPYRIEFNPQKAWFGYLRQLLDFVNNAHISRLDIAIDYKGEGAELRDYGITTDRDRKGGVFWGQDGKIETRYIGARSSEKMCRVYDKAREQGIKNETWWRVEMQNRYGPRTQDYLPGNMFDMVTVFDTPRQGIGCLSLQEKAMLFYLKSYPETIHELDRKTAIKYHNIMNSPGVSLKVTPSYIYRRVRDKLTLNLWAILKGCIPEDYVCWEDIGTIYREDWKGDIIRDMVVEHELTDWEGIPLATMTEWEIEFYKTIPKVKHWPKEKRKAKRYRVGRYIIN
jgi:hypothetical protein